MPIPSRNTIYDATIRRMTAQALEEAERQFAQVHAPDTREQLADYLREWAGRLEHTPWPREITGGTVIQARFGTWEQALEQAGLPYPDHPDRPENFSRVQEEIRRQKVVYRQKKAQKQQRARERMKAQQEKRRKNRKSGIT